MKNRTDILSRLLKPIVILLMMLFITATISEAQNYKPNWKSLDKRPIPEWYKDAKFGIFIHWGLYSVPAFAPPEPNPKYENWGKTIHYAEWYWRLWKSGIDNFTEFHNANYGEDFKYQDFAGEFEAELFDPDKWADIFKKAGAKYVVLTSKHHEGFTLWPSEQSWNWNAVDVGPHRDLAGDLSQAVKDAGLKMGFYYSLYEWYNPNYQNRLDWYVDNHMLPQMKDLVTRYEPDIFWPDGEWDHPSETWKSEEFLAWLYNESPVKNTVVVNDRWGEETRSEHGGYYTTEYGEVHGGEAGETTLRHKWEECRGIGRSFGYNRMENEEHYLSGTELVHMLVDIVSKGGNLLLNIGPTADGRIPVIMQQRLYEIGDWLAVNGEAIYGTDIWRESAEGDHVRYTAKEDTLYAIVYQFPEEKLILSQPKLTRNTQVTMLGRDGGLEVETMGGDVHITMPDLNPDEVPSKHAYVFRLTNVE